MLSYFTVCDGYLCSWDFISLGTFVQKDVATGTYMYMHIHRVLVIDGYLYSRLYGTFSNLMGQNL